MKEVNPTRKNSTGLFRIIWGAYALVMLGLFFSFSIWDKKRVIDWDISYYYSYLPATFIYGDYTFNDRDTLWENSHFRFPVSEEGQKLPVKMTAGMAVVYSPFFLIAHGYALLSPKYPAHGFSRPYRFAIMLSACLASIGAFWLMGQLLMLFYSPTTAGIATLAIFSGTNLPYYSLVEPMSHVYSLALLCGLLLLFFRYLQQPGSRLVLFIGLVSGLILLIRPSNLVMLAFPIILLIAYRKHLVLKQSLYHLLISALAALAVCVPQFIYWHHLTGSWLYYSYGDEGFFFSQPEIFKGLFSYRKGWFVYSPLLLLSLPGFIVLYRRHRRIALACSLSLLLAIYLVFSWWCWWYGGSFGARALIEYLPFVALPLAALIHWVRAERKAVRIPFWLVLLALCAWSLFMNWQYYEGLIHYDAMTAEAYWKQFLNTEYADGFWQALEHPDYEAARQSR